MDNTKLLAYIQKPVIYHTDAGHGWFAVKRDVLAALEILQQVSSYSYMRGATVYLEEDCDASRYFSAVRARFGRDPAYITKHTDRSPIRSYDYFRVQS